MTWTRLDDRWCDDPVFETVDMAARWHYLSMIQHCSRTERYNGVLRLVDARRCSDVDDPAAALGSLVLAGLVENVDGATVRLVRIDQHIPPPFMRDGERKRAQRERKQRERAHKAGDHTHCLPGHCPDTGDVTRDTGTGQDGTGQEQPPEPDPRDELNEDDRWSEYREAFGDDAA